MPPLTPHTVEATVEVGDDNTILAFATPLGSAQLGTGEYPRLDVMVAGFTVRYTIWLDPSTRVFADLDLNALGHTIQPLLHAAIAEMHPQKAAA